MVSPDGVIVTACEAACPSKAITFGNMLDPNSRVSNLKAKESEYLLLGELNTKPRTSYFTAQAQCRIRRAPGGDAVTTSSQHSPDMPHAPKPPFADPLPRIPLVWGPADYDTISAQISEITEKPQPYWWWPAFLITSALLLRRCRRGNVPHHQPASACGEVTSPSRGRSTSPTSCSGSASDTPARSSCGDSVPVPPEVAHVHSTGLCEAMTIFAA